MSAVKLNYKTFGDGQPLLILHGLFGSLDNWQTHAKTLSEYFRVILVDARNHGHSPHTENHNYELIAEDLKLLLDNLDIEAASLIGHSMGGKAVMRFAQLFPSRVRKLVVVDMGIKAYPMHHDTILEGLKSIDFDLITSRSAADHELSHYIKDLAVRQFLLKNLYWVEPGKRLAWRMNLETLEKEMPNILVSLPHRVVTNDTLFLYGTQSNYVLEEDFQMIETLFPSAQFEAIEGAGHWIHAEKPGEFLDAVLRFLLF
jgi:pimeloyl-ACP methyl ester carboxylesterase